MQATNPDRPAVPAERPRPARRGGALVALLLAGLVAWTLRGLWGQEGALLGREGTDALRALWGLDFLSRSVLPPDTPIWSRHANPPAGVIALVLPWVSGVLAAPLLPLLGPVSAYNVFIGLLLWAAGFGTAWLARVCTGSWAAGAVVGAAVLAQPMLLWAVADGTAEHVAIWGLPVFLAAAGAALRDASPRRAALAGLLAGVVALDSPYHAVYAAFLGPLVLPALARRPSGPGGWTALGWTTGVFLATAALLGTAIGLLYAAFPVGTGGGLPAAELQAINAADLGTWRRGDLGALPASGPAPTLFPTPLLLAALGLSLLGLPRALPWVLAGALALALSFGKNPRLPDALAEVLGATGASLGRAVLALNEALYTLPGLASMRFPSRWLVPAAILWGVAAAFGLSRLFAALGRLGRAATAGAALALAALALATSLRAGPFAAGPPTQTLPEIAFAAWIRAQPEEGAVALLPILRAAPPGVGRNDRPVFAGLDARMAGQDAAALQVMHGRPQLGAPGLQTLRPLMQESTVARVLRDWDDLTHPKLTGNPIPPGANDRRADRARGFGMAALIEAGLRWVAVDLGAYDAEGLAELRRQIGPYVEAERRFDEGDGVLVWTLARTP